MNEFFNNPFLLIVVFFVIWIFVTALVARMGGWWKLAKYYSKHETFTGETYYMQSLRVGFCQYKNCVNMGVNKTHIHFSLIYIFSFYHKPITIPLVDIQGRKVSGWMTDYVQLDVKGVAIKLSKKQADRIVKASNSTWQYDQ